MYKCLILQPANAFKGAPWLLKYAQTWYNAVMLFTYM